MKKILIPMLLLLPCFLFAQQEAAGKKLPSVDVKDLDGKTVNTATLNNEGSPMIISFWALWCKPCIQELTTIADVYADWQAETGVKLVAVSIDDSRSSSRVGPTVNGKGWEYEVLLDQNGDFKRAMNVNMIPHTFLVNAKGEIVWQHTSFSEGSELQLIELVRKLKRGEDISGH
ncbi:MAG TPA: TlpA disulfide reductase family protein [Bacteroidales bacterium]|nr:TlpA disulfide reductase family protein [Bacteroidales bacterium]HRZ76794.1 TlpA disulfide reductase family protein [Bacteroidales bacterium]